MVAEMGHPPPPGDVLRDLLFFSVARVRWFGIRYLGSGWWEKRAAFSFGHIHFFYLFRIGGHRVIRVGCWLTFWAWDWSYSPAGFCSCGGARGDHAGGGFGDGSFGFGVFPYSCGKGS